MLTEELRAQEGRYTLIENLNEILIEMLTGPPNGFGNMLYSSVDNQFRTSPST